MLRGAAVKTQIPDSGFGFTSGFHGSNKRSEQAPPGKKRKVNYELNQKKTKIALRSQTTINLH